jgi:hypothetical protein
MLTICVNEWGAGRGPVNFCGQRGVYCTESHMMATATVRSTIYSSDRGAVRNNDTSRPTPPTDVCGHVDSCLLTSRWLGAGSSGRPLSESVDPSGGTLDSRDSPVGGGKAQQSAPGLIRARGDDH